MTVAQSVTAWKQYMSPLVGKGAKLGSMAVTNGGAPMGIAYLQAFFAACPQCAQECEFVALHWYDAAWNTGALSLAENRPTGSLSSRSRSGPLTFCGFLVVAGYFTVRMSLEPLALIASFTR